MTSAASTFVDRLTDADRTSLLGLGRPRSFDRDQHLIHDGADSDHVLVMSAGWAKIVSVSVDGEETVFGLRGPGDLVGEIAALDEPAGRRSAAVRALTPVDATVIDAPAFVRFLQTHPDSTVAMLRELIMRLREASIRTVRHGTLDVRGQLVELLLDLSARVDDRRSGEAVIDLGLTQADLAGLLSCSRDAVAKALADLRADGVISTSRRTITISSRSQLEHIQRR